MGFKTQEQQEAAIQAAALETAKKETIAAVYEQHQEFVRCEANDRHIVETIERYYGPDVLPTLSLFEDVLVSNPDELQNFARQKLAVAQEQVIDEYIALLNAHSRQDQYTLESERKKMRHLSLAVCRQKLQELKTRQIMSAQSVTDLKKFVKAETAIGFPQLPATMWDSSKGAYITVDAAYLNGLVRTDMWQFRRLVKLYGSDAVDQRRGIK